MTADEDDRVSDTIAVGKRFFQLPMNGTFSRHQPAGRHRGAIAVNRVFCGLGDTEVTRQPQIVVTGKVDVFAPVDQRGGPGDAVVNLEEGIGDPQACAAVLDDAQLLVTRVTIEAIPLFRHLCRCLGIAGAVSARLFQALDFALQRLMDELVAKLSR